MVPIPADVAALVDAATPAVRRRDAGTLLELMSRVTGETPHRWGTIVGFGSYHYRYASGREGDAPAAGFAPRKAAMSIYLSDGIESHAAELARLGPHTHGVGCLYVKDLAALDLDVLEAIIAASYARLTAGTFGGHTRDATSHDTPASGDALPKVGAPAARSSPSTASGPAASRSSTQPWPPPVTNRSPEAATRRSPDDQRGAQLRRSP